VFEDHAVYDAKQLDQVLRMVDDGNKSAGGLEKVLDFQYVRLAPSNILSEHE
jgi:hypothetical protein